MLLCATPAWFTKANGLGTVVAILSTSSRVGATVGAAALAPLVGRFSWPRILQIATCTYCAGVPPSSEAPSPGIRLRAATQTAATRILADLNHSYLPTSLLRADMHGVFDTPDE